MTDELICQDCKELQEIHNYEGELCSFHQCKVCGGDNSNSTTDICEDCQD